MIEPRRDFTKILNVWPAAVADFVVRVANRNAFQQIDNCRISSRGPKRSIWYRRRYASRDRAQKGLLITGKEERPIGLDWATEGAAKLISLERILSCRRPVARVEGAVAQELKCISMKLVRAGFGDYVHHGAGVLAILRAVVTRLHAEFLKGIRHWKRLVDVRVLVHIV